MKQLTDAPITIAPAPYVVIPLAAMITGLSEKAIRRKIEEGIWLEDREYKRGPDGHIYISIKGYSSWVEAGSTSGRSPSVSRSRSTANRSVQPSC
jgi:hypothetical protein